MKISTIIPFGLAMVVFCACATKEEKKQDDLDIAKKEQQIERNPVDTIILRKTVFRSQLVSNGKLKARTKASLRFPQSGIVKELNVKNGYVVKPGDVLASLDKTTAETDLRSARQQMEKADLALYDALLGFGYTTQDYSSIPEETMKTARIRSGYNDAELSLAKAERSLKECDLAAPVGGKIANLKTNLYEFPSGNEFCLIIDDQRFEVEFPILESEITQVALGQSVKVATFVEPDVRYNGVLTEINPMVDEKGQIWAKAEFPNPGKLMDGMNVKVYVENDVPGVLVVPKTAVLVRDNLEVLFRYGEGGKALWTYVNIVMANSDSYVVRANVDRNAELNEGDAVIIKGNLTLANESNVEIANK